MQIWTDIHCLNTFNLLYIMNTSLCEQRNTARGVDKYINIENRLQCMYRNIKCLLCSLNSELEANISCTYSFDIIGDLVWVARHHFVKTFILCYCLVKVIYVDC
jgi:hypothetical protein